MNREYNIPESWVKTSIEDIILYQKGKKPKNLEPLEFENSVPYLDIKAFEKKEIRQYADKESSQIIDEQDIVMVWDGARSGWVSKGVNGALGSTIARFRPFLFSQKFLFYFLDSQFSYINSNTKGTGIPHVDPQILWGINFPLPPLNEQHHIVSKIEELFSEMENGVANLKLAQNQLKVYRQALLKHAFEGKLTEQWRNKNNPEPAEKLLERIKAERQNRYEQELKDWKAAVKIWEKDGKIGKKPGMPKFKAIHYQLSSSEQDIFSTIPETWLPTRLEAITGVITDGDHQAPPKAVKGIPFITISNIKNNVIDFSNTFYVASKYYEGLPTYRKPIKGDVLYTVTGSFGIPVVMDFEYKFCFQRHIGLIRPISLVNSKWLYYLLQTRRVFNQAADMATGTAQKTVGLNSLRNFRISICAFEEQNEIVSILDSQFSIIGNLEQSIESGLKKSEALRQSILKKAFEGKLVPQDSNDEPASELLKRIQAEKKKYLEEQKQLKKRKPKNIKKMSNELSIEEVLKTSDKPMLAKDVWQNSKHKENIEEFYAELKKIKNKVKEVKKGTQSLLSLLK